MKALELKKISLQSTVRIGKTWNMIFIFSFATQYLPLTLMRKASKGDEYSQFFRLNSLFCTCKFHFSCEIVNFSSLQLYILGTHSIVERIRRNPPYEQRAFSEIQLHYFELSSRRSIRAFTERKLDRIPNWKTFSHPQVNIAFRINCPRVCGM